jgi:hypothetical protein
MVVAPDKNIFSYRYIGVEGNGDRSFIYGGLAD